MLRKICNLTNSLSFEAADSQKCCHIVLFVTFESILMPVDECGSSQGLCFPAVANAYVPLLVPPKNPEGRLVNRLEELSVVCALVRARLPRSKAIRRSLYMMILTAVPLSDSGRLC